VIARQRQRLLDFGDARILRELQQLLTQMGPRRATEPTL